MKKLISIILTLTMAFSLSVCCIFNSSAKDNYKTGIIEGTSISWSVSKSGIGNFSKYDLVISGTGVIPDYGADEQYAPWRAVERTSVDSTYIKNYETVTIGEGITVIGTYAFHDLDVKSITVPSTLKDLRAYALGYVQSLTSINLPSGLTSIGNGAFLSCNSLTKVNFSDLTNLTTIGDAAFAYTPIKNLVIPNSVKKIGYRAFADTNSALKTVEIYNENNIEIDSMAFRNNSNFTAYVISESPVEGYFRSINIKDIYTLYKVTFKTDGLKVFFGLIEVVKPKTYATYYGRADDGSWSPNVVLSKIVNPPANPSEKWVEFKGWDKSSEEYAYPTENMVVTGLFKMTLSSILNTILG